VVEVQVAVRGKADVGDLRADDPQRLAEPDSARPVAGVNPGMSTHPGIEQDHSLRVADDIAQAWLHPCGTRPGLLRGPHEVAKINTPHRYDSHCDIVADSPRALSTAKL